MSHVSPGKRIASANGEGDTAFAMALLHQGNVAFPRLIIEYAGELGIENHETFGLFLHLFYLVEGSVDPLTGDYCLLADAGDRFVEARQILHQLLEKHDHLLRLENDTDHLIRFSLRPLYMRLRAVWSLDIESYVAETPDPYKSLEHMMEQVVVFVQQCLGRPLAERELNTVKAWVKDCGLTLDVIQVLFEEAERERKLRIDYLDSVAREWAEQGVRTRDQAEAASDHYRELKVRNLVARYLGYKRPLTVPEEQMITKWTIDWAFPDDVVLKACEQTVNIKDPNFRYVDRVLEGWRAQGVRTVSDVEAVLTEHKRRRSPAPAGSTGSRNTSPPQAGRSNVFLPVEKKDKAHYEKFFEKPGK